MSFENRVVWSEGLFLRPQHFQQLDRYHDSKLESRCRPIRSYFWGFHELEVDNQLLKLGKLAVNRCCGILPDGTPFNIPDVDGRFDILEPGKGVRNQIVYFSLPAKRVGSVDTKKDVDDQSLVRFISREIDAFDVTSEYNESANIEIGEMHFKLLLEDEDRSGYVALPIARIQEKRDDGELVLDSRFIPPLLSIDIHPRLKGLLKEVAGSLGLRADALAGRLKDSGRQGTAEIADFMMLHIINRVEPWLLHLSDVKPLHPLDMYGELIQLAGELATFSSVERRPPEFPNYQHDELEKCIYPLSQILSQYMSTVSETSAVPLKLVERKHGFHVSPIADRSLIDSATFVIAVKAHLPPEQLRSHFPSQVKVAPVEVVRDLINAQLAGIPLYALPVAPRQIPYHAGFTYFQLDRTSEFWKELSKSSGFALHVGGDFPGMELEFWAIRD